MPVAYLPYVILQHIQALRYYWITAVGQIFTLGLSASVNSS